MECPMFECASWKRIIDAAREKHKFGSVLYIMSKSQRPVFIVLLSACDIPFKGSTSVCLGLELCALALRLDD